VAETNDYSLALLTRVGRPLVDPESRTDSIKLAWDRLLDKAVGERKAVRRLSFGTLRKTSATWVKNHGGRELQQLQLCHSDGSVAARHYTGQVDFSPLHRLLDAYQQELTSAGMFNAESDCPI
jgi:hypothetical protein